MEPAVSRYRIEEPLGRGGMGEVYRAVDTLLHRDVALKLLRADRSEQGVDDTRRLLREARACAALKHPNVVVIYDVGEMDGAAFIAMELLDGVSLRRAMKEYIAPGMRLRWLVDIASALAAAHRAGITHRDVKPENVIVCHDGTVRLIDFGVARGSRLNPFDSQTQGVAKVAGTPRYMAPEHEAGMPTPASDQFSWGVMAHELVTGLHPADVATPNDRRLVRDAWAAVPPAFGAAVARAMSFDAAERFPSMAELCASLPIDALPEEPRGPQPDAALAETHYASGDESGEQPTRAPGSPLWTDDAVRSSRSGAKSAPRSTTGSARGEAPPGSRSGSRGGARSARSEPGGEGDPRQPLQPGEVLDGRYRVEGLIGRGAMGAVFSAQHLVLGRRVAIKLLTAPSTPELLARFVQEAEITAKLVSPHVAQILDVATPTDRPPYLVMELLEGDDLEALLVRHRRLDVEAAARYLVEACDAVGEAHRKGIVHRDLKPANLFLAKTDDGEKIVKVLDFGLSKLVKRDDGSETSLSRTHAFMGSPGYMSPEQLRNAKGVDRRTDVWSLGVVLYELVSGVVPFPQESVAALMLAIAGSPHVPLRQVAPNVPPELEAIVDRCLEKDPEHRFQDVGELAAALSALVPRASLRMPATAPPLEFDAATTRDTEEPSFEDAAASRRAPVFDGETVKKGRPPARWLAPAIVLGTLALAGVAIIAFVRAGSSPTTDIRPAQAAEASRGAVAPTAPPALPAVTPVVPGGAAPAASASATKPKDGKAAAAPRPDPPRRVTPRQTAPSSTFQPVTDRLD